VVRLRGAGFHTDAHYDEVLSGLVHGGPMRASSCSRARSCGSRARAGDLVVFDPFQPHAVLDPGQLAYDRERYVAAAPLSFSGSNSSWPPKCESGSGSVRPGPGLSRSAAPRRER